jgi:hypothetical protein
MADKEQTKSQMVIYQAEDGTIKIDVRFQDETVWLTQQLLAELFRTTKQNVSLHIRNIYAEGELLPEATVKDFLTVQTEGNRQVKRKVDFYNLDMIISVGYRIKSIVATKFRQWATRHLREFIVKGFVLDDDRLNGVRNIGQDYFDELLERIRDIRASERRFYQKITDIYAECSVNYDANAEITQVFYATVQNKLHWAIHRHTAAELISERADADKSHMGLMTWKNAPKGKIRKTDVAIAKNYLTGKELRELNRIVTMYLDYAEMQAERRQTMTMSDWVEKLDAFLKFNEKDVLNNAGKVSADVAEKLALKEFTKFRKRERMIETQEPVSDFDKLVDKTRRLEQKEKSKR